MKTQKKRSSVVLKMTITPLMVILLLVSGINYLKEKTAKVETVKVETVKVKTWQSYQNSELDFTFSHPSSWESYELRHRSGEGDFWLRFRNMDLEKEYKGLGDLHIVGINDKYTEEEGPNEWFASCAVRYKSIDDFCKEGCEKLNDHLAIDYRKAYHGEYIFSVMAYTDISQKYPSICMELGLPAQSEIGKRENIFPHKVLENYDVRSMIINGEAGEVTQSVIDDFRRLVETIQKI